jgi:hypothetical protein
LGNSDAVPLDAQGTFQSKVKQRLAQIRFDVAKVLRRDIQGCVDCEGETLPSGA